MNILAIIPARSGSKGIKGKNIKPFAGLPLFVHSISAAQGSSFINRIIVSTESESYARIAKRFGAEVPFLRPGRLARDSSLIMDTILHLLRELRKHEHYAPDVVVLLQPTSPLRTSADIDSCISLMKRKRLDGCVSLARTEQLLFTLKSGNLDLLFKKSWVRMTNRQSLPDTYLLNGCAVFCARTTNLLKRKSFYLGRIGGYVMPRWRSIDVDSPEDFLLAELVFKHRRLFSR